MTGWLAARMELPPRSFGTSTMYVPRCSRLAVTNARSASSAGPPPLAASGSTAT